MPIDEMMKWEQANKKAVGFTDEEIDFIRTDLESDMGYTRLIEATKKMFKEQGRDFDAEFKEWERKKKTGGR